MKEPLMQHDPIDLGSVILFRIIPKERTLSRHVCNKNSIPLRLKYCRWIGPFQRPDTTTTHGLDPSLFLSLSL